MADPLPEVTFKPCAFDLDETFAQWEARWNGRTDWQVTSKGREVISNV